MAGSKAGLHELEISQRPRNGWPQTLRSILFAIVFNLGCLMIHAFQVTLLLPLRLIPFAPVQKLYDEGIRYSKGAFATLIGMYERNFSGDS